VQRASGGAQIPWTSSSVDGDFYFHAPTAPGSMAATAPAIDLDQERYMAVKDSRDPDQLEQAAARMTRRDLAEILIERARSLRSQAVVRQPDPAPYTPVNVAEPFRTGFAQWGADQYAAAVNSFTQAIQQGDNTAEAYRFRGLSYRHLGRNSEALADFDQAMRLGDTAAGANRADLAKEMGIAAPPAQYAAPAPAQRTYQPPAPAGDSSFSNAMNLYMQSRYGACVAAFSAVIRDEPNNAEAWRFRGLCYKHEGDRASALSDFNEAVRLGNPQARNDIMQLGKP
jgi:tetratricopeptide (TPR) repeat protein